MVEIKDNKDLDRWLRGQPHKVAALIVTRTALRFVPALSTVSKEQAQDGHHLILKIFRLLAVSWVELWLDKSIKNHTYNWKLLDEIEDISSSLGVKSVIDTSASKHEFFIQKSALDLSILSFRIQDDKNFEFYLDRFYRKFKEILEPNYLLDGINLDTSLIERGEAVEKIARLPLWTTPIPAQIRSRWGNLSESLDSTGNGWDVWTGWYEDRLHGRPFDEALEEARVLIPDKIWEQGPEAVNTEIARLIIEHAERATPQGERLVIRRETGQIGVEPAPVSDEGGWDNACDKVRDRYQSLIARGLDNQFSALRPVIDDLEQAFSGHRKNPRRMHDTFATGVRNVEALLVAKEVPEDLLVVNLQKDMADGVIDIREAVPEVKRMAEARAMATMTLPPERTIRAVDLLLAEAGEAFEPDLGAEIEDDKNRLGQEAEQSTDPDALLPEGELKERAYRLFGRLARLLRMARAPGGEIWAALEAKEAVGKLMDLINSAEVFWAIIRWLIM